MISQLGKRCLRIDDFLLHPGNEFLLTLLTSQIDWPRQKKPIRITAMRQSDGSLVVNPYIPYELAQMTFESRGKSIDLEERFYLGDHAKKATLSLRDYKRGKGFSTLRELAELEEVPYSPSGIVHIDGFTNKPMRLKIDFLTEICFDENQRPRVMVQIVCTYEEIKASFLDLFILDQLIKLNFDLTVVFEREAESERTENTRKMLISTAQQLPVYLRDTLFEHWDRTNPISNETIRILQATYLINNPHPHRNFAWTTGDIRNWDDTRFQEKEKFVGIMFYHREGKSEDPQVFYYLGEDGASKANLFGSFLISVLGFVPTEINKYTSNIEVSTIPLHICDVRGTLCFELEDVGWAYIIDYFNLRRDVGLKILSVLRKIFRVIPRDPDTYYI